MAKYLKQDSELGYIEDSADIQYQKFNNLRHTILGCMLGDFDENGKYVVDPEIKKELIAMKKYIVETVDNIDVCHGCLKLDKYITFLVTFEGNKATLSLVEKLSFEANFKINSGTYSNVNEYILDEVETSGEIDKNVIYRRWNVDVFGGNYLDVFNMDEETIAQYFGIVNRFKYLMMANEILLNHEEELEEIESEYSMSMLELVSRYPKLKEAVIKEINESMKDKEEFIRIDKPNFAKTLNELITKTIEDNVSLLTEEERKDFDIEKHNIQVNYNNKIDEKLDFVVRTESVDDKELSPVQMRTLDVKKNPEMADVVDVAKAYVKASELVERRTRQEAASFIMGEVLDPDNKPIKKGEGDKAPYKSRLITSIIDDGVDVSEMQTLFGRSVTSTRLTLFQRLKSMLGLPIEKHTGRETGEIISSRKLIYRDSHKTNETPKEKDVSPAGAKATKAKNKSVVVKGKKPVKQKAKKPDGTKGETGEHTKEAKKSKLVVETAQREAGRRQPYDYTQYSEEQFETAASAASKRMERKQRRQEDTVSTTEANNLAISGSYIDRFKDKEDASFVNHTMSSAVTSGITEQDVNVDGATLQVRREASEDVTVKIPPNASMLNSTEILDKTNFPG